MNQRHDLIQPGPFCAPCVKEEICGSKAMAAIQAGHALFQAGAWTVTEANRWNGALDRFIEETDAMLAPHAAGAAGTDADSEIPTADDVRIAALNLQAVAARAGVLAAHKVGGVLARLIDVGDVQGLEIMLEQAADLAKARPLLSVDPPPPGTLTAAVTE